LWVAGERGILHGLLDFKLVGFFSGFCGDRFVHIGSHGEIKMKKGMKFKLGL